MEGAERSLLGLRRLLGGTEIVIDHILNDLRIEGGDLAEEGVPGGLLWTELHGHPGPIDDPSGAA